MGLIPKQDKIKLKILKYNLSKLKMHVWNLHISSHGEQLKQDSIT